MTDTTRTTLTTQTYESEIRTIWLAELVDKIDALNKALKRKGIAGEVALDCDTTKSYEVTFQGPTAIEVETWVTAKVTAYGVFALGDWQVRGLYDFRGTEGEPTRWGFPDSYQHPEDPTEMRRCDHCNVDRYRGITLVIANAEGDEKVVGSTCVTDYTGHKPAKLLWYLGAAGELFSIGGGTPITAETRSMVAYALAAIQRDGRYVRANDDEAQPTKTSATMAMPSFHKVSVSVAERDRLTVTAETYAEADAAIAWAQNLEGTTEFDQNLRAVARTTLIAPKAWGIAAYLPEGYRRHQEREAKKAAEAIRPKAPVPTASGPHDVVGEVIKVAGHDGRYGYTVKVTIRSHEGYTVWGTLPIGAACERGDCVQFVCSEIVPSDRDETFGFFKRPRKFEVLAGV